MVIRGEGMMKKEMATCRKVSKERLFEEVAFQVNPEKRERDS